MCEMWQKVWCAWNLEEKAESEMHILLVLYEEHKYSEQKISFLLGPVVVPGKMQWHRVILKRPSFQGNVMRKLKAKGHSETARVLRMLLRTSGDLGLEDPTP